MREGRKKLQKMPKDGRYRYLEVASPVKFSHRRKTNQKVQMNHFLHMVYVKENRCISSAGNKVRCPHIPSRVTPARWDEWEQDLFISNYFYSTPYHDHQPIFKKYIDGRS